eukprot:COSAG02_NODE_3778_length_6247_cov_21.794079_2_plen_70_part_00
MTAEGVQLNQERLDGCTELLFGPGRRGYANTVHTTRQLLDALLNSHDWRIVVSHTVPRGRSSTFGDQRR